MKPPYTLPSNIVYFHDWRYVNPVRPRWRSAKGERVPLFCKDAVPSMHLEHEMPHGVRLVAQSARLTDPLISAESMGESFILHPTVIHENDRYRLWYDETPIEDFDKALPGYRSLVRYLESADGEQWIRSSLGLVKFRGSRENNIVYGGPLTPRFGYHGGCVFRDPSAPPEEKYKILYVGILSQDDLRNYRCRWPDDVDPFSLRDDINQIFGVFGGISPDGLRWKELSEPLLVQHSDTHNVCTYDMLRGKYVAYLRSWLFGRRTIGITETEDFRHFPIPQELFWPGPDVHPAHSWYASSKTVMPGTSDYHVMFPQRWRLPEDLFEHYLATSPDGIVWNFVPGGPVFQPGQSNSWNAGGVSVGIGLVELPGERMGVLVSGWPVPHKYPRRPPFGKFAWAWWKKGRLVALEASDEGCFSLYPLLFKGRRVHLNCCTKVAGYIRVEAVDTSGKVLTGRSFDDCDFVNGDTLDHLVTWGGEADLGHKAGEPVILRFRLRFAELFSVEFKE